MQRISDFMQCDTSFVSLASDFVEPLELLQSCFQVAMMFPAGKSFRSFTMSL